MALQLCLLLCGLGLCRGWVSEFHCPPQPNFAAHAIMVPLVERRKNPRHIFLPAFHFRPKVAHLRDVDVAVIVMHGANRDSHNYFDMVMEASETLEKDNRTAIFAPVFGDRHWQDNCSAANWMGTATAQGEAALWSRSTRQWMYGQKSDNISTWRGISSFQAIDVLVDYVQKIYPRLQRVIFTGFSAGSQFAIRWAVASAEGANGKTRLSVQNCSKQPKKKRAACGVKFSIVLGSPSSYIYVSDRRPSRSCSWQNMSARDQECTEYYLPQAGNVTTAKTCRNKYNKYPWGLACLQNPKRKDGARCRDVGAYVKRGLSWPSRRRPRKTTRAPTSITTRAPTLLSLSSSRRLVEAGRSLRNEMALRFSKKDFHLAAGHRDTYDCEFYKCSDDCEAMGTGSNRLQRAQNFVYHLVDAFPGYKPKFEIFTGGHSAELFFATDTFTQAVWKVEGYDICVWDDPTCFSFVWKLGLSILAALVCLVTSIVFGVRRCMAARRCAEGQHSPGGSTPLEVSIQMSEPSHRNDFANIA